MDSDNGHPDIGVGDTTGRGLVDISEITRLRVGQGTLERHWSLWQREDSSYSTGRVEGCQNGKRQKMKCILSNQCA